MPTGLSPCVHETTVTDCQVDLLIECHRVSIARLVTCVGFQQGLIVGIFVLFSATRGEPEVGQFNVTSTV